jgi:hypothetical protein
LLNKFVGGQYSAVLGTLCGVDLIGLGVMTAGRQGWQFSNGRLVVTTPLRSGARSKRKPKSLIPILGSQIALFGGSHIERPTRLSCWELDMAPWEDYYCDQRSP